MKNSPSHVALLSGKNRINRFVLKANLPIMATVVIFLSFTSEKPLLTTPLCIAIPLIARMLILLSEKINKDLSFVLLPFPVIMIFFIAWLSGGNSPSFILAYSTTVFITMELQKLAPRIITFIVMLSVVSAGCLLGGMSPLYLLTGIFGLAVFFVIMNLVMYFVMEQAEEIAAAKKEAEEQKVMVEEKQKEILDSIKYARRIQFALLPSDKQVERQIKKGAGSVKEV